MALTQIDDRGLKTPIDLIDNEKIRLGTGNDLEIYHSGTNTFFENTTGNIYFRNDGSATYFQMGSGNETGISIAKDDGVFLYFNDALKFQTTTNGCLLGDSTKLQFGAGPDLEIYSDGTNSFVKCPDTGNNLTLESDQHLYIKVGDSEDAIKCVNGAQVELYHNNSQKLTTSSTGIEVSGNVHVNDSDNLQCGDSADLKIYHNGSNYIDSNTTLFIRGDDTNSIYIRPKSDENAAQFKPNDSVDLFYDGSKKFATTAGGVHIYNALGTSGAISIGNGANLIFEDNGEAVFGFGSDFKIYHDGSNTYLDNSIGDVYLRQNGTENSAKFIKNGGVELYYNDSKKFSTTDYGCDAKTIKPDADDTHDLGASDQRWDDVYATNGTIQTSDRNAKKDIVKSDLGLTFINAVEPVSYKFKTGTRTHYGVIAQDLETVLDGKDFAGLTKDTETSNYGVRYTELISPLIKAIQELSAEVETLKTKVAALEAA